MGPSERPRVGDACEAEMTVTIARYLLIAMAFLAAPFYGLQVLAGYYADKRAQRRAR